MEDIFLDANEDKKRKTAREDAQPASKRKKTSYNKKPAKKEPVKRSACDENGANENRNKMARIEGDDQSQTKTALEGTTASINKKNRKLYLSSKIPSFFNFNSNSKKSVRKLENPFPVHIEKSLKVTTEIFKQNANKPTFIQSAVSNAGESPGKTKLSSKISPPPACSRMKKTENKANCDHGQPTTTTHKTRQKIKCERKSKLGPPESKVKKITEFFLAARPPDEIKKRSEAIID